MSGSEAADEMRQRVETAISNERPGVAATLLRRAWNTRPTLGLAQYVSSTFRRLAPLMPSEKRKLFVLRSFTVEPIVPFLRAECLLWANLDLEVHVGEFGTYPQEIIDPNSELYSFNPDLVLLATQTRDLTPKLWSGYTGLSGAEKLDVVQDAAAEMVGLAEQFRSRSAASLIVHSLEQPAEPNMGVFDGLAEAGQSDAIRAYNRLLLEGLAPITGCYVLDYDAVVSRFGRERWYDERKWLTVRLPLSAAALVELAREWTRYVLPALHKSAKVLVTDLDNTLWGGVVGEDGAENLQIDQEYPGAFYLRLQQALLDLHRRGILLAISSKNNEADAMEVFESRSGMLLGLEHFSSVRCNWQDKASNLREIARELNVGVDSLVFLDDNLVEREQVATELPEVTVLEFGEAAADLERAVRSCPLFERLALAQEDRRRAEYYSAKGQRDSLRTSSKSLEDFFYSLEQEVEIHVLREENLERTSQLTQKTNQLNLTTRRYLPAEIRELDSDRDSTVYTVRVRDRVGDNGIVGVCILKRDESVCMIDTLLLSCRVLGRTVESAVLAFVAETCREAGFRALRGWFFPTKKNAPASKIYPDFGFRCVKDVEQGTLWELPLAESHVECPAWIRLIAPEGGVSS